MKNKMDLAQFIASMPDSGTPEHWYKNLSLMFEENGFTHHGDCTKLPCTCNLCFLEGILEDYRKYFFNTKEKSDE